MIEFSGQMSKESIDYIKQQAKQDWVKKTAFKGRSHLPLAVHAACDNTGDMDFAMDFLD